MHMFIASGNGERTAELRPQSQSVVPDTLHGWDGSGQGHDHVAAGDFNGDGFDKYAFAFLYNDGSGPQIMLLIPRIAIGGFSRAESSSRQYPLLPRVRQPSLSVATAA